MDSDMRMFFVRNIDYLKHEDTEIMEREFELTTDSNIIGGCEYGPYSFMMWEHNQKSSGEKRKLCMRIREKHFTKPEEQPAMRATENGLYHGGYIADELVALSSLFLRRRIELGNIVRLGNTPLKISRRRETMGAIDKEIVEGISNLGELGDWFDLAIGLTKEHHQRFILAAVFYHRAILIIEDHPDVAYINLISAVEVLSRDYDIGKVQLCDIDKGLGTSIDKIQDEVLRMDIEKRILDRERFLCRRFINFIPDHIDEIFWDYIEDKALGQVNPDELPELLKRIYNYRSFFLHGIEPFPHNVYTPPFPGVEIHWSISSIYLDKLWEREKYIPYPHFFERLVNHVLKTFLKKNQNKNKDAEQRSENGNP